MKAHVFCIKFATWRIHIWKVFFKNRVESAYFVAVSINQVFLVLIGINCICFNPTKINNMKSDGDIKKVILLVLKAQSTDRAWEINTQNYVAIYRERKVIFIRFLHHSSLTDCRFTFNVFTITLYEIWIADVGEFLWIYSRKFYFSDKEEVTV